MLVFSLGSPCQMGALIQDLDQAGSSHEARLAFQVCVSARKDARNYKEMTKKKLLNCVCFLS